MNLRRFNDAGVVRFSEYLSSRRLDSRAAVPLDLADDPRYTDQLEPSVQIDLQPFESKFQMGQHLCSILRPIPQQHLRENANLWTWLAFWYFDQLCPIGTGAKAKPKENAKYIARAGDHRFGLDKHLVFFPWKMVAIHGDAARFFLSDLPGADTRAQREWTGYHLNVSKQIVELCGRLYRNPETGVMKKGATGKRRGNYREFFRVLKQLEVTFNIHGMTANELFNLLPRRQFASWMATPEGE